MITRNDWVALEKSISRIVRGANPTQSNLCHIAYGVVILALPFMILIGLFAARQWRLFGAYAAAAALAVLPLSINNGNLRATVVLRHFGSTDHHLCLSFSTIRGGSRCWPRS